MVAQGEYIKDIENTDVYTFKMRVNIDDLENEQLFTEIEEQLEEFRIYKEGKNWKAETQQVSNNYFVSAFL